MFPAQQVSALLEGLSIQAEAEEGAFPAGTRMEVREVDPEELPEPVSEALPEGFRKLQTLEFTFYAADGQEVQPLAKVRFLVHLETDAPEEPLLISVDRDGNVTILEQDTPEDGSLILFEVGPESLTQP